MIFEMTDTAGNRMGDLTWSPEGRFTFAPDAQISDVNARLMSRAMRNIGRAGRVIAHSHIGTRARSYKLTDPPTVAIVSAVLKARSLIRDYRVRLIEM